LKDKILKTFEDHEVLVPKDNTIKEEALSALETLGFTRKQSGKVIDRIMKDSGSPTVEFLIKEALKNL
jgi:Holliday junction DNA helicase RuvA